MSEEIAVAARGLTKRYGDQLAVDDLDLEVPVGRIVGFLGPNGAGKSTTMRMLIGLTAPTSGSAEIFGTPFRSLEDPVRTVGSIVDGVEYHPGRKGIDELRVSALAAGLPASRCDEVLELVGLQDAGRKRVGNYSLGMRQRLGIAQAMLGDPKVLLLDEPANGLDPEGIQWVRRLLRHLADEGRAVLVSSHLIGEISRLADDVVVIRRGRKVTQASVAELTATASGGVRVASADDATLGTVLEAAGAAVRRGDGGLMVQGMGAEVIGNHALDARIALHELRAVTAELEDVFMELTSGEGIA